MRLATFIMLLLSATAFAEVKTVRTPDGGIAPQAAVDGKGVVHLIYFKGDAKAGDIYYVTSTDGAKTFGKPIRVNSEANTALVAGTIRGPHLALGKGGRPHVAWMGSHVAAKASPTKDTPMLYTRLGDDGQFEPQRNVIAKHVGMDGGGSVAADADGNVYVAWHAPEKKDGDETMRKLWIAISRDDGKTFAPEVNASGDVVGACACCSVKIFAGEKGQVLALYRNAKPQGNTYLRATVEVQSSDGGKTFVTGQTDQNTAGTCMMSSYAIAGGADRLFFAYEDTRNMRQLSFKSPDHYDDALGLEAGKHPTLAVNAAGEVLIAYAKGAKFNKPGTLSWAVKKIEDRNVVSGAGEALPPASVPTAVALPDGDFVIVY